MAAEGGKTKAFLNETSRAAESILEHVKKRRSILVISHMDADGLAAAGILSVALTRMGAVFRIRIVRWFDENVAIDVASKKGCLIVLTDMGSGYLDVMNEKMKGKPLVILDHHQPTEDHGESFVHVNPHLFGIDGARDLSAAGITYLTAKALSERNIDLAYISVVGALGDLQDKHDDRKLVGVNNLIVEDAVRTGYLQVETDLLFFGRETRPVHKALAYTSSPYIRGISGKEDKSLAFLLGLGIKPKNGDKWRALRDLSHEEKRKLFSALSDYLVSMGYKSDTAMSLLGTVYVLKREEPWTPLRDAREFSVLLNATGRTGKPSLGVAICMGDRGRCLEEAHKSLREYRQTITKYLRWLDENPDRIEEMEDIYVLHGGQTIDERVISAISTILSTNMPNIEKPLIAYSLIPEEKLIKVSARTAETLTSRGLDLGEIMRVAAEQFSGNGGGHNVAAGAQVSYEQKEKFLKYVDELVRDNLKRERETGS
jgi:RecJ-like exonuclease